MSTNIANLSVNDIRELQALIHNPDGSLKFAQTLSQATNNKYSSLQCGDGMHFFVDNQMDECISMHLASREQPKAKVPKGMKDNSVNVIYDRLSPAEKKKMYNIAKNNIGKLIAEVNAFSTEFGFAERGVQVTAINCHGVTSKRVSNAFVKCIGPKGSKGGVELGATVLDMADIDAHDQQNFMELVMKNKGKGVKRLGITKFGETVDTLICGRVRAKRLSPAFIACMNGQKPRKRKAPAAAAPRATKRRYRRPMPKPPTGKKARKDLTVPELKAICRYKGIRGYSRMRKASLLRKCK